MPEQSYDYSLSADFPGGAIDCANLVDEIAASSIVTALNRIDSTGDSVSIVFASALSAGDKTTLDGDTTGPAGGLIAAHDNEESNLPMAHTEDATLQTSDIRYHTNKGSGSETILTLPSPKGLSPDDLWIFEVVTAQNFRMKAAAGHTLQINSNVSIAGGYVESADVGSLISFYPSSDNCWMASSVVGAWDLETS